MTEPTPMFKCRACQAVLVDNGQAGHCPVCGTEGVPPSMCDAMSKHATAMGRAAAKRFDDLFWKHAQSTQLPQSCHNPIPE